MVEMGFGFNACNLQSQGKFLHIQRPVAAHNQFAAELKDIGKGGTTINFSIWGKEAKELEPADKTHGTIKTRQFTHEGTGWAGRLAYPWKVGTRYQVFVHLKHLDGNSITGDIGTALAVLIVLYLGFFLV